MLDGRCTSCGRLRPREDLSRTGRCTDCGSAHVERAFARGAIVHPTLAYALDEAAQRFVAEHPDGATLDEVGAAIGMTRERIRQIEDDAIAKMRRRAPLAGLDDEAGDRRLMARAPRAPRGIAGAARVAARNAPVVADDVGPEPITLSPDAQRVAELLDVLEARLDWIRTRDLEAAGDAVRELLAELPDLSAEDAA